MSKLNLISVPIGNVQDITYRARKVLEENSRFIVEDTRSFKNLLNQLNISVNGKEIISYFDHSDKKKLDRFISFLEQGEEIFLCSEAGSPIISDPAFPVVRAVIDAGFEVTTIPGVSSVVAALEVSGLPPNPFSYYGFISREKSKKTELFNSWQGAKGTKIFFESTDRLLETLNLITQIIKDAEIVIVREITKKFESVYRFTSSNFESMKENIVLKGECVVLVYTSKENLQNVVSSKKLSSLVHDYIEGSGKKNKVLSKIFAEILGLNSKEIYSKLESNK